VWGSLDNLKKEKQKLSALDFGKSKKCKLMTNSTLCYQSPFPNIHLAGCPDKLCIFRLSQFRDMSVIWASCDMSYPVALLMCVSLFAVNITGLVESTCLLGDFKIDNTGIMQPYVIL
jgi:hypothetical protein